MSARLNGTAEAVRQSGPTTMPQDMISAAIELGLTDKIQAAAPACWNTGMLLMRSASPASQALGHTLALDALMRTPGALALVREYLAGGYDAAQTEPADMQERSRGAGDSYWQLAGRLLPAGVARTVYQR